MSYQVLARKWRPREFSSLIGQQAVVTALTNALRDGKIAQAYLFSGIRGVGKTTAARLFAKALNCEKGPELGPCNDCATCHEITAGSDMDVLEIDAATYSKVEQVRELSESLKYGPTRDPYKVVVLDEVHRLSRQAFDALLKIVEEPPPRLVFIFATTEADAVPATILSRCQEFHFRRVGAAEVAAHLAEICRAESIRASERALRLVARAGEGSVRDSVALLDQLATFGSGEVLEAEAARLVGGLDLALFGRLLGAIVAGDPVTVVELARTVEEQGWDPRQVHAHFLGYCKDALHLALGGPDQAGVVVDLPPEEAATVATIARAAGYENLLRLLHHLLSSEATVRRSDAAQLALELAWLRAAELPKLLRVEELLAGAPLARPQSDSSPSATPATRDAAPVLRAPRPASASRPSAPTYPVAAPNPSALPAPPPPPAPTTPTTPTTLRIAPNPPWEDSARGTSAPDSQPEAPLAPPKRSTGQSAGSTEERIERFREELSARRPTLAARLAGAKLDWHEGTLSIAPVGDDPLETAQLARKGNHELLDEAAVAAFGPGALWRLVEPTRGGRALAAAARANAGATSAPPAPLKIASDPRVQAVLDIFGGSVQSVARVEEENGARRAEPRPDPEEGSE